MCGGSKSSSSSDQSTQIDETTLTSLGSSGDVIKGQDITINTNFDERVAGAFDTLLDVTKDSIGAVTSTVEKQMSGYDRFASESVNPNQSSLRTLAPYFLIGFLGLAYLGARK